MNRRLRSAILKSIRRIPTINQIMDDRDHLGQRVLEYESFLCEKIMNGDNTREIISTPENCWFGLHIMKTAGTSFRVAVTQAAPLTAYPTHADLIIRPDGNYLPPADIQALYWRSPVGEKSIIFGHYSFEFLKALDPDRRIACFFREPVARTLSMAHHAKRLHEQHKGRRIIDIIEDEKIAVLNNYQTKIMAMPAHEADVNSLLSTTGANIETAIKNLRSLDFVGLTEEFSLSLYNFSRMSNIHIRQVHRLNRSPLYRSTAKEIDAAKELNSLDLVLYQEACAIFREKFNSATPID